MPTSHENRDRAATAERQVSKRPIAIVAMGGHAFMAPGELGTIEQHRRNATAICEQLMGLVARDYNLVITHGNGPQVGALLLREEQSRNLGAVMPLDVLVADTEGRLGYILQQALLNELHRRSVRRHVVTVICQVLVDAGDPALRKPTKPVGPFLSREEAEKRQQAHGWEIVEDAGRGWRRVVPSPRPTRIVQRDMIRDATVHGHIVITCGGGGIPICENTQGDFEGIEAVVDKDRTSAVLGAEIGAELLVILTAEPRVYLNYKKPNQVALSALTMGETERYLAEGHFAAGSMGPKVEAILDFLKAGGRRGLITSPELLNQALDGEAGTHFVGRV